MITFPTAAETFLADQEQIMGRKLSEAEKELCTVCTDVFNLNYREGLNHDRAALDKDLALLDKLIASGDPDTIKFSETCRFWMIEAWKQGAERSAIDGQ